MNPQFPNFRELLPTWIMSAVLIYFYKDGINHLKAGLNWVWVRVRRKCIVYISQYKASRVITGKRFVSVKDISSFQTVESVMKRNWEKRQVR